MSSTSNAFFALDVPPGIEFGMNLMTFEAGPKFKGIGAIPNGLHFASFASGMSLRQGYFFYVSDDVVIRSWDVENETLSTSNVLSNSSTEEFLKCLYRGELNSCIGLYSVSDHHVWENLTKFISPHALTRANCIANHDGTVVSVLLNPGSDEDIISSDKRINNTKPKNSIQPYFENGVGRLAFLYDVLNIEKEYISELMKQHQKLEKQGNNTSGLLTQHYMDKSVFLRYLITNQYNSSWKYLLGELQISFILFLLISSYDALKHWQYVLDLVANCSTYLLEYYFIN